MANYGIKISQPGYDVGTASDNHLVMTSKLNSFKINPSLQGTLVGTISTHGTLGYTFAHNLGYVPAFQAWFGDDVNNWRSIFQNIELYGVVDTYADGFPQYSDSGTLHFTLGNKSGVFNRVAKIYYIVYLDTAT